MVSMFWWWKWYRAARRGSPYNLLFFWFLTTMNHVDLRFISERTILMYTHEELHCYSVEKSTSHCCRPRPLCQTICHNANALAPGRTHNSIHPYPPEMCLTPSVNIPILRSFHCNPCLHRQFHPGAKPSFVYPTMPPPTMIWYEVSTSYRRVHTAHAERIENVYKRTKYTTHFSRIENSTNNHPAPIMLNSYPYLTRLAITTPLCVYTYLLLLCLLLL